MRKRVHTGQVGCVGVISEGERASVRRASWGSAREVSRVQPSIVHQLQICRCNLVVCVFLNLTTFVTQVAEG